MTRLHAHHARKFKRGESLAKINNPLARCRIGSEEKSYSLGTPPVKPVIVFDGRAFQETSELDWAGVYRIDRTISDCLFPDSLRGVAMCDQRGIRSTN